MLQRLPIALAQINATNTSEKLLNETWQIKYSFYWAKQITKKVHNNIMNSIKLLNRMDTIFTKSEKSKTCGFHRFLLNFSDKINLKRSSNYVALFDLSI